MDCFLIVCTVVAVMTAADFIIYGLDKLFAVRGMWRIPEAVLLILSLLCGGAGGGLAMLIFRHKIRKPLFVAINIFGTALAAGAIIAAAIYLR